MAITGVVGKQLYRWASWLVERIYNVALLLRLFFLLLDSNRSATQQSTAAGRIEDEQRVASGTAWAEFCDSLKAAGEVVLRRRGGGLLATTALDQAEGYRYLSRLVRGGLEGFMENSLPSHPRLRPALPYNVKMGADNPDNLYLTAPIDGRETYRIWGRRGTIHYLGFGAYAGNHPGRGKPEPTYLDAADLALEEDGSFELVLSPVPHGGNWMPLERDIERLLVRQTYCDRAHEVPAQLCIERTGAGPPPPLTASQLLANLKGACLFIHGINYQFPGWVDGFAKRPNTLGPLPGGASSAAWADPNLTIHHGYWVLREDEVLSIVLELPACEYWNFQLNNIWMESMDYESFNNVSINQCTAVTYAPGSVSIVIAHKDPSELQLPGVPRPFNWISTTAHRHGTMALLLLRSATAPVPVLHVLPAV